ncbi:glycosyl transferase family 2 [Glycomyces artemisiae]|uniref:Glycosyl transferase family 2 n=1 Tax=Glycomyces artemisiae TaxID=1076443 RepID=A0A2T0UX66_9ACTN|nr:glycosyl transferase family 2 [Glycomyces artemisiae]
MTDFLDRLVGQALSTAKASRVADIHEWAQYHNSRLAPHVLARIAHPEEPEALLHLSEDRTRLDHAALDLEAVCTLAAAIGLKATTDAERAHALALFDLAHRRLGGSMPAKHQELHVMTAYLLDRPERVKRLRRSYQGLSGTFKDALRCQDAHPRRGGTADAYLRRFREFTGWADIDWEEPDIDRLRTAPAAPVEDGPLISVVMTCFQPDARLLTAVRSVAAQSWQRWELLLVDDGSGPGYAEVLREAAGLDPRVKLLIQPENAGTYQARNRAMAVAEGEFITGLDSDDWAHPLRLQHQVQPLLDRPELVMVESVSVAVNEDLSLVIDPQIAVLAARSTPIMIRAREVMQRIGFYDEVRRSADSEYRLRVKAAFGAKTSQRMKTGPLTLVRYSGDTLSAGEVSRHWMSASRFAYHSGFVRWHRRIATKAASPFLASVPRPRPFPVSQDIVRGKAASAAVVYEHLYAADWSALDKRRRRMLDDAARRTARGAAVGLLHCPEWVGINGKPSLIDEGVLQSAAEHGFDFVDPEAGHTAPVSVPTAAFGEFLRFEHPVLAADRLRVQSDEPAPQEAPLPAVDRAIPKRPMRSLLRAAAAALGKAVLRRRRLAAAAGLGALAVVAAAGAAGALVGAVAAALCLLAAAVYLVLRRALARLRAEAVRTERAKTARAGLPEKKRKHIEQWEQRLLHGWSASAGAVLTEIAERDSGHYESQVRALAALCAHRAAVAARTPRKLDLDIVIVSTLNLRGGTTSANEAEILAYREAGLKVGLVHHPVKDRAMSRPVDPRFLDLVDGERVVRVQPEDTVRCDLAIVRFPVALEQMMEDRPQIDAERTVLLVNQTPFEEYGLTGGYGTSWSIPDVHRNVTEWLGRHTWYPIGPAVRDTLRAHHAAELDGVDLADDFWYETIDLAQWTPERPRERAEDEPFRLGRHSRDHVTKFPNMAARLRAAYPADDGVEVHMLGGHDALRRILGAIPPGWTSHPFGSMPSTEFLWSLDAYAYFVDENLVEAFGRAPLEAMAAGVPCLLPPDFAELFGDGALYCEPEGVAAQVRRLADDRAFHAERAEAGRRVVRERFSPQALLRRVAGLGVTAPARAAVPVPAEPADAVSLGGNR